jgi:polyisoprenoid-binding protein YceI
MKNLFKSVLVLTIASGTVAFTTPVEEKIIETAKSTVTWKGYKVTGSHHGTVALKSGKLEFEGDQLSGGHFVVDMTTIVSNDLTGEYKGKLEGHLKSDDFFGVENHPEASLKITGVEASGKNSYKVTADLTIKGKTNPITFDMSVYGNKANATLKIDRSKYDVKYGSGSFFDNLGDKTIYDEFDLVVDMEFKNEA